MLRWWRRDVVRAGPAMATAVSFAELLRMLRLSAKAKEEAGK